MAVYSRADTGSPQRVDTVQPGIFWSSTTASNREPSLNCSSRRQSVRRVVNLVSVCFERQPHHAPNVRFVVDNQHAPFHDCVSLTESVGVRATGRTKVNVAPRPGSDATRISPPCARTICCEMASPRPALPVACARHLREFSKESRQVIAGIPGPYRASDTSTRSSVR